MATIHEINEDWQREGLSPTWVKLQAAQAEFDALQKQMESQKDEWLSWQAKREALEKDAARLEALDLLKESYGFQDMHEGNRWTIEGPFRNVREAIDAAMKCE